MSLFSKLFYRPLTKEGFPKAINGLWYCGAWYMDKSQKGLPCFNPWKTAIIGADHSDCIDGLIPAMRIGDKIGLYIRVGKTYWGGGGSDLASWDDGMKIDLKFVKSVIATKG